jgi:broad specificity phosphatase PhoE
MPPTIHCVRHAQGFHNLGSEFHSLPDPLLTPLGQEQCEHLRESQFSDQTRFSLITASPLTRTLHTAFLTFRPALTSTGKCQPSILAIPDAQEISDFPCDTGSDVSIIRDFAKEQNWPVDLSLLTSNWNIKSMTGRYSPQSDAINARAKAVRQLLRLKARELAASGDRDCQIALVAHGDVLHYITGDWEHADKRMGTGWENCETRSYTFAHDFQADEDDDALIVETMSSRRKRGLDYPMYGKEEQKKLFEASTQGWENQGLQRPDKLSVLEDDAMAAEQMGPLHRERTSSQGGGRRPSFVKAAA